MTSETDQEGNVTTLSYPDPSHFERSLTFNSGSSVQDSIITVDGIGRQAFTQRRQAPGSATFDSVQFKYGWNTTGPFETESVPYSGPEGQGTSSPVTTTQYDAAGRVTSITDGGGGYKTYSYNGRDVLITLGPKPTGENLKQRQMEYDAFGRLTSVCELTGTANGGGSCAQANAQTGFWTKYSYDLLGDLTSVTQNAQGSPTQTRTFQYDHLGRLTQEGNPESGTTQYTYDSDTACGTFTGDLVKRQDANGTTTCYAYDSLHRVISIAYPTLGSGVASTSNKYFTYDAGDQPGTTTPVPNPAGHMVEAYTATCQTCSKLTDVVFGYSPRGEVSDEWESTPNSGEYYHLAAIYWPHGAVEQLTVPGVPQITYTVDGEGRISGVNAISGQNPVTSVNYQEAWRPDAPTTVTYGSGDYDTFDYYSNTGRLHSYQYTVGATPQNVVGSLTWNTNGTLSALSITDPFDTSNNQSCTYAYDDLARLSSSQCGSVWSQTFSYDPFGNIKKSGTLTFEPGYDETTNRYNSGLPGLSYDTDGNLLNDSFYTYSFDGEGKPSVVGGISTTYDALGRLVEENNAGAYTQFIYAPTGAKVAAMNGKNLSRAYIPLPGGGTFNNASSVNNYRHPQGLGSVTFVSSLTQTMGTDRAYAPYGELYANAGGPTQWFAGIVSETHTNLYDATYREYHSSQGRWISPDPAGLAAINPSNPQTWNRYAYVAGSPLNGVDPTGLACYALERKLFGSCAGLMDNGVNFGVSWNEFTILTRFVLQTDLATEVTHTIRYGDLSSTVDEGGTFYPASVSIGTGWLVLGPSTGSPPFRLSAQPSGTRQTTYKQGCDWNGFKAGLKAAGTDLIPIPPQFNPDPVGAMGDLATSREGQAAAIGVLYEVANGARFLAPAADVAADFVPIAGEIWLAYQVGHALYEGGVAYKESVDQCYGGS